jgi:hypothetical protein
MNAIQHISKEERDHQQGGPERSQLLQILPSLMDAPMFLYILSVPIFLCILPALFFSVRQ